MYYTIYEVNSTPIAQSSVDACSIGEHIVFTEKCAVVEALDDKEKSDALQTFGKWLKKEQLGELKKSVFILNEDVRCGKHFADRYAVFHQLAEALTAITEDDYLHRFQNVRNLTSDLMKAIVDDDDDYVLLDGSLFTMDEFLRQAKPEISYHIGMICKYHR